MGMLMRGLVLSWRSKMSNIFLVGWNHRRQEIRLLSASTKQSDFSVVPKGTKHIKISSSSQTRGTIINFGWKVVPYPLCIPDHFPSDYQLLGPLKNAYEDIIMPMTGQCRMPSTNGCRRGNEGQQTISGYQYMFLFKVGKQMSTKMDITLKNSSALSNVVVKSCEIFKYSNCN